MFIGEDEVPVMNTKTNMSQTWNGEAPSRMNNAVSIIELEGKIEVKLQANFALLGECVIRPLSAKITPKIDENRRVISFEISSPGQYTVELRSKRTFHLFVNEYKEYEKYKNESNVLYFELENDFWCCARPSGTEPKIRIMVECQDITLANKYAKSIENIVKQINMGV